MQERFSRVELLLGAQALRKFAKAKVAVFGLGAVGSFAVEALARSGVGNFLLVDFDQVRRSNFNRQLCALESNLGRLKAEAAAQRVRQVNPSCKVRTAAVFAGPENLSALLSPRPDVVIDAIDSLGPKAGLITYCATNKIPLISSMGSGGKTDPFSIRAGDIRDAGACPLARRLRKLLKKKGFAGGLRCVYSLQRQQKCKRQARGEEEFYERGRKRVPVGTLCYMSGIFGLIVSYEAMRMLGCAPLLTEG